MALLKNYLFPVIFFISLTLGQCRVIETDGNYVSSHGLEPTDAEIYFLRRELHVPTCKCDKDGNGICKSNAKTGDVECICNPGFGVYETGTMWKSIACKECNCGRVNQKDGKGRLFSCKLTSNGFMSDSKTCFCDAAAGYYEKGSKCAECNCGQRYDGVPFNCTSSSCICGQGYREESTKCKPHDVCSLMPCLNNGRCKNELNEDGFECACLQGTHGRLCEKVGDICASKPCRNDGHCISIPFGYGFTCECQKGFKGKKCEESVGNVCDPNPCMNNGHCDNSTANDFQCLCLKGFKGKRCEERVFDVCSLKPCLNDGICISTNDAIGFTCECQNRFKGMRCETHVADVCDSNPCMNNGRCINTTSDDFRCECLQGFKGKQCDERVFDVCTLQPCLHNGICRSTNDVIGFKCECENGFKGMRCEKYECSCSSSSKKRSASE